MKNKIITLVEEYKPNKIVETTVSMKLVLKDNEPVYQKARRLAANEREIVNIQIEEWINQGIVRPSSSEYASPIVLVRRTGRIGCASTIASSTRRSFETDTRYR